MTLLLKSNDISPYSNSSPNNTPFTKIESTGAGYMTGCRTNGTFYINLDSLLGEDYDNNDLFKLELCQYAIGNKSLNDAVTYSGYSSGGDTMLSTLVSGLDFVNGLKSNLMGHFSFKTTVPSTIYNFTNTTAIFYKPKSPQVNLRLQLFSIQENYTIPSSWFVVNGSTAPPFIYLFRITPYTTDELE